MDLSVIKQTLSDAINSGEILNVIYQGGGSPGAARMISPIKLDSDGVWARCINSNHVKHYLMSKMVILDGNTPALNALLILNQIIEQTVKPNKSETYKVKRGVGQFYFF